MAIFNFPIRQNDHAAQAVRAAREMQHRWRKRRVELMARKFELNEDQMCIGIGISSGNVNFGEFGQTHRDLTAIGTVVNTAARAQSAALAGEVLVTAAVRNQCKDDFICAQPKKYELKGLAEPVDLYDAA